MRSEAENPIETQTGRPWRELRSNKWFALTVVCAVSGLLIGGPLVSLNAYTPILEQVQGWSSDVLDGAATAMLLSMSISSIVSGRLIDRFSPKFAIVAGTLIAGAGSWLAHIAGSPHQFMLAYSFVGLGLGAATTVSAIPILSNQFGHDRGTALGIYFASMSLACAILPVATSTLIHHYSWRTALLITAAILVIAALPALVLHTPSAAEESEESAPSEVAYSEGLTAAEALRSRSYWSLLIGMALAMISVQGVLFAVVSYLSRGGMSTEHAVQVFSVLNLFAVPAAPAIGYIADRVGARAVTPLGVALQGIGTLAILGAFAHGDVQWTSVGIFAVLWGTASVVAGQTGPMLLEDIVGPRHFGELLGINVAVTGLLAALAPLMTAFLRNAGGYSLVFCVYGGICLAAAPLIWCTNPKFRSATGAK